jgi:hypothetical protein
MHRLSRFMLFAVLSSMLAGPPPASAKPKWLGDFAGEYPSATRLNTCGICHTNFTSNSSRNAYGNAWKDAGGKDNPVAGFRAIEDDDSDGDGTPNGDEILLQSGFMPGYNCENYTNTSNAPADLADFVDPLDIGCDGMTTTSTTLPPTTSSTLRPTTTSSTTTSTNTPTTTTSSTTTTIAAAVCAQPLSSGPMPTASDCLFILNAAVGATACSPECICAPKGSLPPAATDALLCLNKATGIDVALNCPC